MTREAYIVDAIRTPIGRFGGSLKSVRVDDLAALVIAELVGRNPSLDRAQIDDVIMGCANQAGEDNRNLARMALLLAGLPETVPGETVNRLCASGMSACVSAARCVRSNDGDLYVAGGAESMTRAPFVMAKSEQAFSRSIEAFDTSIGWRFPNPRMEALYGIDGMGNTAENVAERFAISREDQDLFALRSQQKAAAALASGRMRSETVDVLIPQRKSDPIRFSDDEFPRADSTLDALSKLRPAFRFDGNGTVTAGNSSGINDAACALIVASGAAAKSMALKPRARFVSSAVVGVEPKIMGIGPVEASRRALERAGLSIDSMDVIELNEAFAAQSLACLRLLGLADNDTRVNVNGGAIALGHPLGMSGARLLQTAMIELELRNGRYALCTMCVGVGQGMATIIERVD